jgi:cytochrome c-type biogenesis protein CcmF
LLAACFAVLCGTLFPILSEWVRGFKITVGAPFFNKVMLPIGLFLIFLTAVGPLLAWRKTSLGSLKKNFAIPAALSLLVAIALIPLGVKPWNGVSYLYAWLTFVFSTLVIATILSEFIRGGRVLQGKLNTNIFGGMYHLTRRNMRRYGGYIVHFGVILACIGIAGQAFNQEKEQEMAQGDKLQIGSYTLVGQEYTEDDNANYGSRAAVLDVYKNGKYITRLSPEHREFKASNQGTTIVADYSTLKEDLYVIYEGLNPDTQHPIIKAFINPLVNWLWIGVLTVVLGTGLALVPNAAPMKSPVAVTTAAGALESGGGASMRPAGARK